MNQNTPKEHPPFDLEHIHDSEIAPLMTKIIEICKTHKIPMLASFMYAHNKGEESIDSYCTTSLGAEDDWQPYKIEQATRIIRQGTPFAAFAITQR